MKTRIITAAVGLAILACVLCFFHTVVLNVALAAVGGIAIFELLRAGGLGRRIPVLAACIAFCALNLLLSPALDSALTAALSYLGFLALGGYLLKKHAELSVKELFFAATATLAVTFSLRTILLMRADAGVTVGLFYFFLVLGSAWLADSGAYFAGVTLGRHKLCPAISPKKTVEGLIGGIVAGIAGNLLICWLFSLLHPAVAVNDLRVLAVSPALVAIGVMGDLLASVIKRQCGIKDYGNIMPGHGGIMDRFDSVLLICPAVWLIHLLFPLISVR